MDNNLGVEETISEYGKWKQRERGWPYLQGILFYFFKIFFLCGPFLKSLLNLLHYSVVCFGFLAGKHMGS